MELVMFSKVSYTAFNRSPRPAWSLVITKPTGLFRASDMPQKALGQSASPQACKIIATSKAVRIDGCLGKAGKCSQFVGMVCELPPSVILDNCLPCPID